jgi:hypothetical protein
MEISKNLEKIHLDTQESLLATREDLKLHFDSQEETEQCMEKMQEQLENFQRAQGGYENLIQSLYHRLNQVLQENKENRSTIERLKEENLQLKSQNSKFFQSFQEKYKEKSITKKTFSSDMTQTISSISSKLHLEFSLLKMNLKQKYKKKIAEKRKKWVSKYKSLDIFYQESLQSLQLLHQHRLNDSNSKAESLIHNFFHPYHSSLFFRCSDNLNGRRD